MKEVEFILRQSDAKLLVAMPSQIATEKYIVAYAKTFMWKHLVVVLIQANTDSLCFSTYVNICRCKHLVAVPHHLDQYFLFVRFINTVPFFQTT